jgi:2'-5' RNA ligase
MRLFTALLPPEAVLDEVAAAIEPHRAGRPLLHWLARDTWHVTLAFLGEAPDALLPELSVRLARAARRYPPMSLAFSGAGAFPSAARGRVFWFGMDGEHMVELRRLVASLEAGARRAGVETAAGRRFRPHLSLARSRQDVDLRSLRDELRPFRGATWRADAVHLMQSRLGGGPGVRARYESLAAWPLAGRVRRTDDAGGTGDAGGDG